MDGKYYFFLLLFFLLCSPSHAVSEERECVILLHGLARTKKSMLKMEKALRQAGYGVVNNGYPSRSKGIEDLSIAFVAQAVEACLNRGAEKIHFVTHSMGGILVRYYLKNHPVERLGRVVMLSPPNRGSEVVDKLGETALFKWINGPAGRQLGTGSEGLPGTLGPATCEVGVITGDRSVNPFLSLLIPGPDDGKVAVERAKLEGMADFLVVHRSHPFIMNAKEVIHQTMVFLKEGRFTGN